MKQALREIYKQIPLKQQFFEFARIFIKPSESIYKHLHFQGDFKVRVDESHAFSIRHYGFELENSLFWMGLREGWEKISVSLWTKLVERSEVIFDVGANTGVYSLIAKSINEQARVFAFEPVHRVFEKLEYNNHLNGFDIECFECALSNTDGTATVYDTPTEHIYSVTVNKNLNTSNFDVVPTEIQVTRLDTFIEQQNVQMIDLMKIDVETHEPEVLEGFGKYLIEFKPTMLIEILSDEVGERVEKLISGCDYLYFNIDEKSASVRKVDRITKSDYYNYLICNEQIAKDLDLLG